MKDLYTLKNLSDNSETLLNQSSFTIGRDAECDIRVKMSDLSRQHAKLSIGNNQVLIEDLNSTNGTQVNNKIIRQPTEINGGDVISFGRAKFLLMDGSDTNKTIVAHHLSNDDSYVIDRNRDNKTAFLKPFPRPPGWENSDDSIFQKSANASHISSLNALLEKHKIGSNVATAVFMDLNIDAERRLHIIKETNKQEWTVGRDETCDVTVEDITVSGIHATIKKQNRHWKIIDGGSTNGIKVEGKPVVEAEVKSNDLISIGKVELIFRAF